MNIGYVSRPAQPASQDAGAARTDARELDGAIANTTAAPKPDRQRTNAPAPSAQPSLDARASGPQPELSRESVEKLVERISEDIRIERRSLSFTIDDDLGRTIVKVIDPATDEVIRQIPSEELLRVAEAIHAMKEQSLVSADAPSGTGLLIQEKA